MAFFSTVPFSPDPFFSVSSSFHCFLLLPYTQFTLSHLKSGFYAKLMTKIKLRGRIDEPKGEPALAPASTPHASVSPASSLCMRTVRSNQRVGKQR